MMRAEKAIANNSHPSSLGELLKVRAAQFPDRLANTFIDENGSKTSITFSELLQRSEVVAEVLSSIGPAGCRGLLLYPSGIDFLVGFLGCSLAHWVPVPTCFPKPGRPIPRLDSIARTCNPTVLLSDSATLSAVDPSRWSEAAAAVPRIATDQVHCSNVRADIQARRFDLPECLTPEIALLQFTSGSTSEPKGVMVSHGNMMANLEAIRVGFGLDVQAEDDANEMTSVFWLPPFHDMGLIGGLLSPLFVGAHSVILSPNSFLSRPLRWLQTISEYRAIVTGAPNFAYQLCVDRIDGSQCDGLKLDCLKVAFCGAEPIQGQTLEHFTSRFSHTGFKRSAMFPCYGLAESTLYVSGGHLETNSILTLDRKQFSSGSVQPVDARTTHSELTARVVSCGTPARGTEILIVDPKTHTPLAEDLIGEIWIRGCSVAKGYWETQAQVSPQATASATSADESSSLQASFRQTINGQPADSPTYLHTGDLGFFHNGQLFITGRSKDVIILRGRNHYPQDIEFSVSKDCENDLLMVAAVMCTNHGGEEFAIVAEMGRTTDKEKIPELIRTVRRAVIEDHDVDPVRVVLVRPASLPRTTSGKLQRSAVREMLEQGTLSIRGQWDRSNVRTDGAPLIFPQLSIADGENAVETIATKIESWMLSWLVIRVGVSKDEVSPERSLDELGLDSLTAVELSSEIEDWLGLQLTPMVAYEHPTPSALSSHLANEWVKKQPQKSIGSS